MIKIPGIYEHGVIRPLKKLPLNDRQRVEIVVNTSKSTVKQTRAIIHVSKSLSKLIAESPRLSPLGG